MLGRAAKPNLLRRLPRRDKQTDLLDLKGPVLAILGIHMLHNSRPHQWLAHSPLLLSPVSVRDPLNKGVVDIVKVLRVLEWDHLAPGLDFNVLEAPGVEHGPDVVAVVPGALRPGRDQFVRRLRPVGRAR